VTDRSCVVFLPHSSLIHCRGCGENIPLSRVTMMHQERIVEELGMVREIHSGCASAPTRYAAMRERVWRVGLLTAAHNGGRMPDRVAYRC
jgi:hypothetical protein